MQERKWQGRTSGGSLGQNGLMFLMRSIDIRLAYFILRLIIPFRMLFARKGCNAIYSFFRKRLGYSPWHSFVATYKNHYLFGQTLLDKFAVFACKRNFFEFEIEGQELFSEAIEKDSGMLFAGAHVGSFEILGYFLNTDSKPINALIFGGEAAVMQTNRGKVFQTQNVNLIPVADDMSHIFALSNAARRGEIISILCDRFTGGNKSVEVNFMETKVQIPSGAFIIANSYGLSVLSVFVLKHSTIKYNVIINKVEGASVKELAEQYALSLEQIVRQCPNQWFNFYDFFDGQ